MNSGTGRTGRIQGASKKRCALPKIAVSQGQILQQGAQGALTPYLLPYQRRACAQGPKLLDRALPALMRPVVNQ